MRKLLLLSLFSISVFGSQLIEKSARLYSGKKGFIVQQEGKFTRVGEYNLDGELRKLNMQQRATLIKKGGIALKQLSDGEHYLSVNHKLKGGGVFGAWLGSTLGYGLVTLAGHGAIHLIALCTGPAYVPVAATLTKMAAIPIHAAATAVGVAGGIAGGVATGPV